MNNCTVGVKLLSGMSAVISKFLNQVLIALAKLVLRTVGQRESLSAEMLKQILEKPVRQAVFVGPGPVSKDSLKALTIAAPTFSDTERTSFQWQPWGTLNV